MKQVTGEYEIVDDSSWVLRHPGAALTIAAAVFSAIQMGFGAWIDDRQQPQWDQIHSAIERINSDIRSLSTLQLERDRHSDAIWARIAESANVKMPSRPKELDRAEERVRKIQERVN